MRLTLSALAVAALVGFGSLAQAAPTSSSTGVAAPSSAIEQVAKKRKMVKAKKAKKMKKMTAKAAKRV